MRHSHIRQISKRESVVSGSAIGAVASGYGLIPGVIPPSTRSIAPVMYIVSGGRARTSRRPRRPRAPRMPDGGSHQSAPAFALAPTYAEARLVRRVAGRGIKAGERQSAG